MSHSIFTYPEAVNHLRQGGTLVAVNTTTLYRVIENRLYQQTVPTGVWERAGKGYIHETIRNTTGAYAPCTELEANALYFESLADQEYVTSHMRVVHQDLARVFRDMEEVAYGLSSKPFTYP